MHFPIRRFSNNQPTVITEGTIWKQLLIFFFPILFGTFFQQLYNTIDAIIVGQYLGKEALAAVGGGTGTIVNLLVGFFTGLSSGATVIISQFYGAKQDRDVSRAVGTAFALSIFGGFAIMVIGFFASPKLLQLLDTPQEILPQATTYIRIYFLGILPSILYNMGSGILRAIGDSKNPLYFLIIGTFLNIILDILFIAVFKLGVAGAAFATILSQFLTMILVCRSLRKTNNSYKLIYKNIKFDTPILRRILLIGLPAGIQSIMYTVSNLIIQTNINSFGTDTAAAWAAYGKIDALFWMSVNSFGIAITTFVGQNYGAKKPKRIKSGINQCFGISAVLTVVTSVIFCIFCRYFYMLFTKDENVINIGVIMVRFLAPTYLTFLPIEILSGSLRGCGKSLIPTILTCGGVCLIRIIWLGTVVQVHHTIQMVCYSYPISWCLTSVLFIIYYLFLAKKNFGITQAEAETESV